MQSEIDDLRVRVLLLETLCKRQNEHIVQLVSANTGRPTEKIKSDLNNEVAAHVRKDLGKGVPAQLPEGAEMTIQKWLFQMLH